MQMRFALVAVAVTALMAATSTHAEERARVRASSLKCRATPEPAGQVVAKLRRGERVRVVGHSAAWARIRTNGHPPCWTAQRYLTPDADVYRGR